MGFNSYPRADNGNVVQVAALKGFQGSQSDGARCTVALAFDKTPAQALRNARASLAKGFEAVRKEYEAGWRSYVAKLPRVGAQYQRQFEMAAMVLKALEDKTYRGATIASPSIPWGGGPNANEPTISGYHAVWSRDLYQIATALDAIGDRAGANGRLTISSGTNKSWTAAFRKTLSLMASQSAALCRWTRWRFPLCSLCSLDARKEPPGSNTSSLQPISS